jgi:hypothetical protein
MTDSAANEIEAEAPAEMTYEQELQQLRARQNFGLAILAGLAAALAGALLWAVIVYVTEMELGLVAIAVGALVGYAVRRAGNGVDPSFSILGAVCAALGWAVGTVFGDIAILAKVTGQPFLDTATGLGFGGSMDLAVQAGDPIQLLFLAIAVYEGWKFARHHV